MTRIRILSIASALLGFFALQPAASARDLGHLFVATVHGGAGMDATVGGTMDSLARYHSYFMEAKICKYPGYTECGIIRIGGNADFAELKAPHYGARIVRPGGMIDFGDGMHMDFPADGADLPRLRWPVLR